LDHATPSPLRTQYMSRLLDHAFRWKKDVPPQNHPLLLDPRITDLFVCGIRSVVSRQVMLAGDEDSDRLPHSLGACCPFLGHSILFHESLGLQWIMPSAIWRILKPVVIWPHVDAPNDSTYTNMLVLPTLLLTLAPGAFAAPAPIPDCDLAARQIAPTSSWINWQTPTGRALLQVSHNPPGATKV
jgi:hypothetical protein